MPIITAGDEQFHLSHEEEDKLNQFQSITNFKDEDLAPVIKLLKNHGWNLEAAISRYYDADWKTSLLTANQGEQEQSAIGGGDGGPPPYSESNPFDRPPAPGPRPRPRQSQSQRLVQPPFRSLDFVFTPALPIVRRLPANYKEKFKLVGLDSVANGGHKLNNSTTNPAVILLMLLPNALLKLISFLWSVLSSMFGRKYDARNKNAIFRVPKSPVVDRDPIDLSDVFLKREGSDGESGVNTEAATSSLEAIRDLLGDSPRLEFNKALEVCQEEFKFLLLILVGKVNNSTVKEFNEKQEMGNENDDNYNSKNDSDLDTNSRNFLRYVLGDSGTLSILNDYKENLVVYLGSVLEVEPWLVARDMKVKYTPEWFLIGNVLNSNGSSPQGVTRLSVLAKLHIKSARRFQNSLKVAFERFNPEMVVSRTEREELRISREIRQLQEQAYEDSLRKDQMKANKRELERQQEELKTQIKLQKEQERKLRSTLRNLKWLELCLKYIDMGKREKASLSPSSSSATATLQIRTSGGKRMVKKFAGETSLYSIYADIGCHLYLETPSLEVSEWTEKLVERIRQLADDDSVLCFKDNVDFLTGNTSDEKIAKLVSSELEKWERNAQECDVAEPEIRFNFELISPYPRYKVPSDASLIIREVPQLWPNGSLLVEHIVEEEEDSELEDSGEDDS